MPTDEAMLQEAISAARSGEKDRAQDLLARLLKMDRDVPEHWLWMSAVVETRQEQIYCLQNLRRLEPENPIARRGLILLGELEAGPKDIRPVSARRPIPWTASALELSRPSGWQALKAHPALRAVIYTAVSALTIALLVLGASGFQRSRPPAATPDFEATAQAVGAVITLTPTQTPAPTDTPALLLATPTPAHPTPLALLLETTYTPTPRYVNTPHPQTEAFRLGLVAQTRRDWEAMADLMQQTIEIEPGAADAYYYLGLARMELAEYSAALQAFTSASQIDRLFGPAYLGRALSRLALDADADVSRDFQNAISRSSDFGPAYIERARYLINLGRHTEAARDLNAAEALLPGSPDVPYLRALSAFLQEDYETASEAGEASLERDQTALQTYRLLGEIAFAADNPEDSVGWLTIYVRYHPEDRAIRSMLARALSQTGQFEEAIAIFDALLDENGTDAEAHLGRGLAHLEHGDPTAALADLNRANRFRRNDFDIMLSLGRALIEADDPGDAYIQLNQTLVLAETDPQKALLYFYRGLALSMLVDRGDNTSRPAALRDLQSAERLAEHLEQGLAARIPSLLAAMETGASAPTTP